MGGVRNVRGKRRPMRESIRYARHPDFVHRRIADEVILLPIRHNFGDLESIFTLNGVAARVWELLDGQRTPADIVAAIVAEYAVTEPEAERDLGELMDQLETIGAVCREDS
jgi:hypothetical protein